MSEQEINSLRAEIDRITRTIETTPIDWQIEQQRLIKQRNDLVDEIIKLYTKTEKHQFICDGSFHCPGAEDGFEMLKNAFAIASEYFKKHTEIRFEIQQFQFCPWCGQKIVQEKDKLK